MLDFSNAEFDSDCTAKRFICYVEASRKIGEKREP